MTETASRLRQVAPPLILVAVCVGVYARSVGYFFIWGDDQLHLFLNKSIYPPTWAGMRQVWLHAYSGLYIPVSYTVFAALNVVARLKRQNVNINDTDALLNPHVFHAANIVLHVANTLIVYAILKRCVKNDAAALVGALLFAIHPLQVEAVAWVSELRGLLAALFGFAAVLIYTRAGRAQEGKARRITLYCISTLPFALALLSKPSAIVIPIFALVLDQWINRRDLKATLLPLLPWALMSALLVVETRSVQGIASVPNVGVLLRPLIAGDALAFYIAKLLLPIRLSNDYCRTPTVVLGHWWGYIDWIVPAIVGYLCWRTRKTNPQFSVAAILFVVCFLPVLGLVPFTFQYYSTVADRYCYLGMLGPALALSYLWTSSSPKLHKAILVVLVIFVACSSIRLTDWRNTGTLTSADLALYPQSSFGHADRSAYLNHFKHYEDALTEAELALKYHDNIQFGYLDLGNALFALGRTQEAVAALQIAVARDPGFANVHLNLGSALLQAGNVQGALIEFDKSYKIDPASPRLHYNVGNAFMAEGRNDDAIKQFRLEIKNNPTYAPSYVNAAVLLINANQPAEAIADLNAAIALGSAKSSWYVDRGIAEQTIGNVAAARADFTQALVIDPTDSDAKGAMESLGKQ
jgi:tetratricopeptide (TPR) repeat protein